MKYSPSSECNSSAKLEVKSKVESQLVWLVFPKRYRSQIHSTVVILRSTINPPRSVSCVTYNDIFVFCWGLLILPSKALIILSSFCVFIALERFDLTDMKKNHSCICIKFCSSSSVKSDGRGLPRYLATSTESASRAIVVTFRYQVMLNILPILVMKGLQYSVISQSSSLCNSKVFWSVALKATQGKKLYEKSKGKGRKPSGKAYYLSSASSTPGKGGRQKWSGTLSNFGPLPRGYMPQSRLLRL